MSEKSWVKSLDTLLFLMFLKEVAYDHLVCIYLIRNTERTKIVKLKIKNNNNK